LRTRIAIFPDADLVGQFGDVLQQGEHLAGPLRCRREDDQFDRVLDFFQVGAQLSLDVGVQHVISSLSSGIEKGPPSKASCFAAPLHWDPGSRCRKAACSALSKGF
jgi:hypothetical protein